MEPVDHQSLFKRMEVPQYAYFDLIPVLTSEGILSFLLETLLALREALVFCYLVRPVASMFPFNLRVI
jgi:hypothetical protein